MKLTKIRAGHYRNEKGEVRDVFDGSGAPHTRNRHAKWLVTFANGTCRFVPTLARAREVLA